MPPPSLLPLAFWMACAITRQAFKRQRLPEPLPGRPSHMTTPAFVGRNVILHRAHGRNLRPVSDLDVIVKSSLGADRHVVTDRQAAGEPDLRREQNVPADGHIVADLDLIVDFGAL